MSVKVSSWVWHEARDSKGNEIAGNELVLMLALADVADDNGRCRFIDDETGLTYDSLAEKVRVSKRTVVRMVAAMLESGLIDQVKGTKGKPNEFRVLVPWTRKSGANLAPNEVEDDDDSVTTATDSVTTDAVFGDNDDTRTSPLRDRSSSVSTVAKSATPGQRFAQPLCDVLASELQRNSVKYTITKRWLDAARLMVDADGRDPRQAKALIEWACRDSFWSANIHSMPTFRDQFDKLRLRSDAPVKQAPAARAESVIEMGQRLARQQDQKSVNA